MWVMITTLDEYLKNGERPSSIGVDYKKMVRLGVNDTVNLKPTIKIPLLSEFKLDQKKIEFMLSIYHNLGEIALLGISEQFIWDATISGYGSESSLRYVHCPKCGKIITCCE